MDMFVVQGGLPLRGTIRVSGSKNAALPIMAASLAVDGPVFLDQVPELADIQTMAQLLEQLGMKVVRHSSGRVELSVRDAVPWVAPYDQVRKMRAGICVLGPLLARRGSACVSLPGGCNIGYRPIDLHLKGLEALGAHIRIERGYVVAKAARLRGAVIDLIGPAGSTVTGTCNVLTAACLARGTTVLKGAAREPEVVDLGRFLISAGAQIKGLGTSVLEIEGVDELQGTTHRVIPDRIEAATLLIAAGMTRGEIRLEHSGSEQIETVIALLRQVGLQIEASGPHLDVSGYGPQKPVEVTALPYPGFPTDVQAQFTALLCLVPGRSVVTDQVFPDRFLHLPELGRLGARIRRDGASGIIDGVPRLSGASVMASDLRASAALVLAALAAEGESVIRRIYHLDRGYERLEEKLCALGAHVRRIVDIPANVPRSLRPDLQATDFVMASPHFLEHPAAGQHREVAKNERDGFTSSE